MVRNSEGRLMGRPGSEETDGWRRWGWRIGLMERSLSAMRTFMKRSAWLAGVLLALANCKDDGGGGPVGPLVGTWTLASVNGQALPFTLQPTPLNGCGIDVMSGSVVFRADSTYSYEVRFADGDFCESFWNAAGSFTADGADVTLNFATPIHMTLDENGLTQNHEGRAYRFGR